MEWVDGVKMSDVAGLAAAGHDLKAIAANLVQSFLRHTLRDGFFHADMHPGNLFVEANGTIVAVDLGIMGRLGKKERRFLPKSSTASSPATTAASPRCISRPAMCRASTMSRPSRRRSAPSASRSMASRPKTISMAKLLTLLFEVTELFDMADPARTGAAAEDHGGGRRRGAHARSRPSTCGRLPSRWSATGSPAISVRAGTLSERATAPRRLLVAARRARSRGPHRAAVACDRPDGRATGLALRSRHGERAIGKAEARYTRSGRLALWVIALTLVYIAWQPCLKRQHACIALHATLSGHPVDMSKVIPWRH